MKIKLALVFLTLSVLVVAQIQPPPPSGLTAFDITYLAQTAQPVVEFIVPDSETNELVFTGQTGLAYSPALQNTVCFVGCTNVVEIAWQTRASAVYRVMVRTNQNDAWTYTKVKIVGDGNVFRYYSVANPSRTFNISPGN